MNITYSRRGGFSGDPLDLNINTNDLQIEESKTIKDLVNKTNFFNIPVQKSEKNVRGAADYFRYSISIRDDNNNTRTIEFTDLDFQENQTNLTNLSELINFLTKKYYKDLER